VPEDREKDEEFYRRHIAGEIETYRFEKRLRRKDGVKVWVSVRSTLVRDEAGRMRYTVRAIQDISRRKIVEQKLLESERHTRELLESLLVMAGSSPAMTREGRQRSNGAQGLAKNGKAMRLFRCPGLWTRIALASNRGRG
jgi:PAS domain-containing protein